MWRKKRTLPHLQAGDEYIALGPYEWHITAMKRALESVFAIRFLRRVSVEELIHPYMNLNEDYLIHLDNPKPILLVELYPGEYSVIDGQHRLTKAYRNKQKKIWAYRLPLSVHLPFLTSEEAREEFARHFHRHRLKEALKRV